MGGVSLSEQFHTQPRQVAMPAFPAGRPPELGAACWKLCLNSLHASIPVCCFIIKHWWMHALTAAGQGLWRVLRAS